MPKPTRRRFLEHSAAGLALGGRAAASDRLGVACIGVRGQGNALLRTFAAQPDVEIRYICDIDESVRERRVAETEKSTQKRPRGVKDYRTVLDEKDIDVVVSG